MTKFTPIELQEESTIEEQIINCDLDGDSPPGDSQQVLQVGGTRTGIKQKEWASYTEFLLASLSYAVGLGNIWRFPYLVYRNGGGAFFIPYFVMLFFVGIPLFVLEFAFGQYMQTTPIKVWVISPLFSGIGYAMCLMSALVSIYYNMIIAWSVRYLSTSMFQEITWNTCNNTWNTKACLQHETANCTKKFGTMLFNGTCMVRDCFFLNGTNVRSVDLSPAKVREDGQINCSIHDTEWSVYLHENSKMPSDEYFHNEILGMSSGIDDLQGLRLDLVLCLFICWMIVFACLYNGLKSIGKSSYFTAFFPYLVITILFVRCITLDGAGDGIYYYMNPVWSELKNVHVWSDAAMQIFFSLSPCWGGIITLAKGNSLRHNFIKDSLYISIGNMLTSVYAGFVIFSIIGFMAKEMSSPIRDVVAQGAGLAFIAYPEAVTRLPISRLWAILFFTMLCTLGFGTQFTLIESVVATITETFYVKPSREQKRQVLLLTVLGFFAAGLLLCTHAGMYILQLMDDHCASFSALVIGLFELNVIVYVFGVDRFLRAAQKMLGTFPLFACMWKVIWMFITPTILAALFLSSVIKYQMPSYGHYQFPVWSAFAGWALSSVSVIAIPIVAIYKVLTYSRTDLTLWERVCILIKPSPKWVPPRFGDEDDDDDSSSDDVRRNGTSIAQKMKQHRPQKKSHHLHLSLNAPTHCESQIALRNAEEEEEDSNSDNQENVFINGTSSLYVAPGFRHNTSFDLSDSGLNMYDKANNSKR